MASVFWDAHGEIFIDYLEKGEPNFAKKLNSCSFYHVNIKHPGTNVLYYFLNLKKNIMLNLRFMYDMHTDVEDYVLIKFLLNSS